jgi:hypothetical protein
MRRNGMLAHVLDLEVTSDVYYIKDENKSATNRSNMWSGRTIVYPGLCRCLRKWAMSTTAQDESVDRVWAAWRTGHQYEGGDVRHQKAALSAAARPLRLLLGNRTPMMSKVQAALLRTQSAGGIP